MLDQTLQAFLNFLIKASNLGGDQT